MKIYKILLMIILTITVGTIKIGAQTVPMIEKRIGNTIYELNSMSYSLKNKANKISNQEVSGGGGIAFLDNSEYAYKAWLGHFKPLFTKERAAELNVRITLYCICDSTGMIHEIMILFTNRQKFEMFTLKEIKAIEDSAKKYRFNFLSWRGGEDVKYVNVIYPLNPYLLYFEKPK